MRVVADGVGADKVNLSSAQLFSWSLSTRQSCAATVGLPKRLPGVTEGTAVPDWAESVSCEERSRLTQTHHPSLPLQKKGTSIGQQNRHCFNPRAMKLYRAGQFEGCCFMVPL